VRCESCITFRNKKREYMKEKINELETSRTKLQRYRGINEFMKG
jgi:hypothetical protein